jgi:hypothetical protein
MNEHKYVNQRNTDKPVSPNSCSLRPPSANARHQHVRGQQPSSEQTCRPDRIQQTFVLLAFSIEEAYSLANHKQTDTHTHTYTHTHARTYTHSKTYRVLQVRIRPDFQQQSYSIDAAFISSAHERIPSILIQFPKKFVKNANTGSITIIIESQAKNTRHWRKTTLYYIAFVCAP